MRKQWTMVVAAIVLLAGALAVLLVLRQAPPGAGTQPRQPPRPIAAAGSTVAPAGQPPAARSSPPRPGSPADAPPLPPLVQGNPLTDEHFAGMSAKIVLAALGLKKDNDYNVKLLEYMNKVLEQEKITPAQYEEYAEALHRNRERGQAVAENIVRRVEKKLGHRMDLKVLPMLKFDEAEVKKIEKKLRE